MNKYHLYSLLLGYLPGCILTAEIVCRRLTGKSASELGTSGNPGMANVMAHLGFKPGIIVLAGDLGKCILACLAAWLLFGRSGALAGDPGIGRAAILWAGLGCTAGHDFPFWRGFRGGKGVATSCIAMFLGDPLTGLAANAAGMLTVFATKYLTLGGLVIPAVYAVLMYLSHGAAYALPALGFLALTLITHWKSLMQIPAGTAEKVDVLGAIRRKFGGKKPAEAEENADGNAADAESQ